MAYGHIPQPYLTAPPVEGPLQTCLDPAHVLPHAFSPALHVGSIVQTPLRPQAQAPVVLCRSDPAWPSAQLGDYSALRFQRALPFRDANQDWGLADGRHVTPTGVIKAAQLSLFMVNGSSRLRRDFRQDAPEYSILDVKASYRGYKYVDETIQMLPAKPEPV